MSNRIRSICKWLVKGEEIHFLQPEKRDKLHDNANKSGFFFDTGRVLFSVTKTLDEDGQYRGAANVVLYQYKVKREALTLEPRNGDQSA
jgi:hypothetical protein